MRSGEDWPKLECSFHVYLNLVKKKQQHTHTQYKAYKIVQELCLIKNRSRLGKKRFFSHRIMDGVKGIIATVAGVVRMGTSGWVKDFISLG